MSRKSVTCVWLGLSVKSVRIRSYSGLHFLAFGLNTERYSVSLRIQSECGKMRIMLWYLEGLKQVLWQNHWMTRDFTMTSDDKNWGYFKKNFSDGSKFEKSILIHLIYYTLLLYITMMLASWNQQFVREVSKHIEMKLDTSKILKMLTKKPRNFPPMKV